MWVPPTWPSWSRDRRHLVLDACRYDTLTLYSGANSDPEAVLAQYKGELRPYEEVLPILLGNHSARVEFDGGGVGGHTGFDVTFRVCASRAVLAPAMERGNLVPCDLPLSARRTNATDPAECAPGAVHVNGTATGLISTNPLGGVLPGGLECVWILYLPDPGASVRLALQAMAVPNSATVEIRDGHLPSSPLLARIDNTRNFRVSLHSSGTRDRSCCSRAPSTRAYSCRPTKTSSRPSRVSETSFASAGCTRGTRRLIRVPG